MLHTFLSFFIIFFIVYGIEGFGVSPEEILARPNDTIRVLCSVDQPGGKLNFYDDEDLLVSESYIERFNNSCIEMSRRFTQPIKKNYTCRQGRNNVGQADVYIDERMAPVENFKCRTNDLTNVQCSFKKPLFFHPISYRLSFTDNENETHIARLKQDGKSGYFSKFRVPYSNRPIGEIKFDFYLHANCSFYERDQDYSMKLLEILTPKEVQSLKVRNNLTTHNRAIVTFTIPKEIEKASQHLTFDVRLKLAEDDETKWKKILKPSLEVINSEVLLVVDNIDFANMNYEVVVKIKAKAAADTAEMWSPPRSVTFKTSSKAPESAPISCRNCFNVMDNGNVVVYWMDVPKHYQNADNFSYLMRAWDENEREIISEKTKETSFIIRNDLITKSLSVKLFSENSLGRTANFSKLLIRHPTSKSIEKLLKLRKELIEGEYKISWKLLAKAEIESFTVLWCNQRSELPNQCDGAIRFKNLPANTTEFMMGSDELKAFGVAVNLLVPSYISGFEWAECTASKPNRIGEVHSFWSSVDVERSITIHWKLNCVDEPITKGYNISYCSVDESDLSKCNGSMESEILILNDDEELSQYQIKNLTSYSLYNVTISLMSHTQLGMPKAPISVRTLEGAPTAPRNLKALEILQNSIVLSWNRPLEVNGESITYQLWYNDHMININNDNNTMNEVYFFKLELLKSFTNYTITVVACTSDCSESSDSLVIRTAISAPGIMLQPKLVSVSKQRMLVSWNMPEKLGGNLDYFQLKHESSDIVERTKVYRINGQVRACFIEGLNCEHEISLFIRGVNVEENESVISVNQTVNCFAFLEQNEYEAFGRFYGFWSQPVLYSCLNKSSTIMIAMVMGSLIVMVATAFFALKVYHKIMLMKDIHIVWPKGLDPDVATPSPSKDSHDLHNDLDLIRDHAHTDIEVEHEEQEKLIKANIILEKVENERLRSEEQLAGIPKNTEQLKVAAAEDNMISSPKSILVSNNKTFNDVLVDPKSGYMKMRPPINLPLSGSSSPEGYLDMSGKTPSPVKKEMPRDNGYTLNDIKMFIRESELTNNGYIGKRSSLLSDPSKKNQSVVNSNGYVLQTK